jgi:hypothetical protein
VCTAYWHWNLALQCCALGIFILCCCCCSAQWDWESYGIQQLRLLEEVPVEVPRQNPSRQCRTKDVMKCDQDSGTDGEEEEFAAQQAEHKKRARHRKNAAAESQSKKAKL